MWVKGKFPAEYAVNNTIFDGPLLINMVYIYIYIYFLTPEIEKKVMTDQKLIGLINKAWRQHEGKD